MKAQTIKDYLAVHTWVGIVCGMVLFVAFYAGAFSMLEPEISRWTRPTVATAATPSQAEVNAQADASVRAFFQDQSLAKGRLRLHWPSADHAQPVVQHVVRGQPEKSYQLKDGRLQALDLPPEEDSSGNFVDYLHRKGGLPLPLDWAEPVIGLVSLAYALALVSGVVVLLPTLVKDLFYLRLGKNLKRMWLDVHNLLGVASLPFHIVIAFSAAVFGLHDWIYDAQDHFIYRDGLQATVKRDSVPHPRVPEASWLPPSEIKQRLAVQVPQFQTQTMDYVKAPDGNTLMFVAGRDDRHFKRGAQFGYAFVHLGTGQVYDRVYFPGDTGSALSKALSSFFSLHFGSFGGDPVRVLYVLLGLSGALLFYTGNLLWIETRSKRLRANALGEGAQLQRPRHVRVVSALTQGVCLGCAAGLPFTLVLARWLAPLGADANFVHQAAFYAVFVACMAWALWRGTARAAPGLLAFTALCNAALPITALLLGWRGGDGRLLEALCAVLALFFGWLAWRHGRALVPAPKASPISSISKASS